MKKKKLKERNSELLQKNSQMLEDIYTLIDGKDFMKITEIKFRYNFHRDFVKMVTYGSPSITPHKVYGGGLYLV